MSRLVNCDYVKKNILKSGVRILETTTGLKNFGEMRIPGASSICYKDLHNSSSKYLNMCPSVEKMQSEMRKLGIKNDDEIIIYDKFPPIYSTCRIFYLLTHFGHKNVKIMNGGFEEWKKFGGDIEKGKPKVYPKSEYKVEVDPKYKDFFKNMKDMKIILEEGKVVVGDTRNPSDFETVHFKNSIQICCWEFSQSGKSTWKTKEQLAELFKVKGIPLDKEVITVCYIGCTCCAINYVLEFELGSKMKNYVYDGSMTEYVSENHLQVKLGPSFVQDWINQKKLQKSKMANEDMFK